MKETSENDKLLSIIVPVYNGEKFIEDNIRNLIGISISGVELIYVDDGSTDGTADIIDSYASNDERIRLIRKENGGPGSARNTGLDNADGRFVVFVDSDDRLDIDEFQNLVLFAEEHEVDLLQYEYRLIDMEGNILEEHKGNKKIHEQFLCGSEYLCIEGTGGALQVSNIYSRDMLVSNEIRMAEGVIHEDVEYVAVVVWYAKKMYVSDACVYNYRMRPGSIMHTKGNIHEIDFGGSVKRLKEFAQQKADKKTYEQFFLPFIVLNYYNISHVAIQNGVSIRRVFKEKPLLRKEILEWLPRVTARKYRFQYLCFKYGFYELYELLYKIYNSVRVSHIQ